MILIAPAAQAAKQRLGTSDIRGPAKLLSKPLRRIYENRYTISGPQLDVNLPAHPSCCREGTYLPVVNSSSKTEVWIWGIDALREERKEDRVRVCCCAVRNAAHGPARVNSSPVLCKMNSAARD